MPAVPSFNAMMNSTPSLLPAGSQPLTPTPSAGTRGTTGTALSVAAPRAALSPASIINTKDTSVPAQRFDTSSSTFETTQPGSAFNPEDIVLFDGSSVRTDLNATPNNATIPTDNVADLRPISFISPADSAARGATTLSVDGASTAVGNRSGFTKETLASFQASGVQAALGTSSKSVILSRGSVLFAPEQDITVDTTAGRIAIGANAVVLVIAMHNGVAIYDLHDAHAGDVFVTSAKHTITMTPGRHLVLTHQGIPAYEHVNPLEVIGHRNLKMVDLEGGLRQFSSDFSLVSALNGLCPLMAMKHSSNPRDAKVVEQMMKDAAILMQTKGSLGGYHRMSSTRSFATAQK
jgi:hypothetical protein